MVFLLHFRPFLVVKMNLEILTALILIAGQNAQATKGKYQSGGILRLNVSTGWLDRMQQKKWKREGKGLPKEAITCVILDPHSRDRDEPQYWWPCSSKIVIAWQSVAQIMHLSISDLSSPFFLPSLLVTPAKLSDWSICEERSKLQDLMPHKIDIQNQWLAQVPKYADQVWYLKAGAPRHGTPTSGGP